MIHFYGGPASCSVGLFGVLHCTCATFAIDLFDFGKTDKADAFLTNPVIAELLFASRFGANGSRAFDRYENQISRIQLWQKEPSW